MPTPKDTLDRLNINTPCTANWDEMVGNDQVRFCQHCNLSVHNLSTMTRRDAMRLVSNSNGKLCARYIRRPDGKIHTTDLVLHQIHSVSRRASRIAAGAFTAALSLSASVVAAAPVRSDSQTTNNIAAALFTKTSGLNTTSLADSTLKGTVTDPNGAVVAGANITIVEQISGVERSTTTNDEGVFLLEGLEEGLYTLSITSPGFALKEISDITLRANEEQTMDQEMEIAGEVMGGAIMISEPTEPLVAAAFNGDVDEVKRLLSTGADVNVLDEDYDSTALAQAVARGHRDLVKILLNAGADVNEKSNGGQTALMQINGQTTVEIVQDLIAAGAKVDIKDDANQDALHHAASYANPDALQALLQGGAAVDSRDEEELTALMLAANAGRTENVAVLLKAGATVNLRNEDGATALGLAIANDDSETAKVLRDFGATE